MTTLIKGKHAAAGASRNTRKPRTSISTSSDSSKSVGTHQTRRSSPYSPGQKKTSEERKRKRECLAEDQTSVSGKLGPDNPYLLADRLEKVQKLVIENTFYNRYEKDRFGSLGFGEFGNVCKFRDKKIDRKVAVKVVNKDEIFRSHTTPFYKLAMYCEAACFSVILPKHRHIVEMERICETPSHIFYVMECLAQYNLTQSYRAYTSAQARTCFFRILQAVDHLHQHGIIHGDLKLENICLRENDNTLPILVDFGCCHYESRLVRRREEAFVEKTVFTPKELNTMRQMREDVTYEMGKLTNILELFLTGEGSVTNQRANNTRYPPKPGTDRDALALLEFMRTPGQLAATTSEQLMQHCWFEPERAREAAGE